MSFRDKCECAIVTGAGRGNRPGHAPPRAAKRAPTHIVIAEAPNRKRRRHIRQSSVQGPSSVPASQRP